MQDRAFRQSVPRPENFEPGRIPPWANRFATNDRRITLADIRDALEQQRADKPTSTARSAVLVPLYEQDGEAYLVLIRRATSLVIDPGHIAFPGGRIEPGETEQDAALREAEEEVGIASSQISFVEALPMAHRRRDQQSVAPFVGFLSSRPTYSANVGEVDTVIEAPLSKLLEHGVAWEETWRRNELAVPVAFFADQELLGDDLIWGLTARILWDLLDRITAGR